jgi:DnaJ-class molecular chaperone
MQTETTFDCPRCAGTGIFSLECADGNGFEEGFNGFEETCRPCGGTGRVTRAVWEWWCDLLNGRTTVDSFPGPRGEGESIPF